MADIVRVVRIEDLEQLDFSKNVDQDNLGGNDFAIVSHNDQNDKMQPKKVTIDALGQYILDYIKSSRELKFEDLGDGDQIMEETINKIQLDSFTDKVYSMRNEYKISFDGSADSTIGDYWRTDEIVIEEDCTAHIHADIIQSGTARAATDNDVMEIQLKDQKEQWVTLCSQPRTSNAGILELDYHAKLQAGCILRVASRKHGSSTKLGTNNSFDSTNSGVFVTLFSNDTPFIESIVSRYLALGNNKSALSTLTTTPFVADKPGVVWFNGTYTQGTNMLCTANWLVNNKPYHTPTVYAQALSKASNNAISTMYLGNTEDVIPFGNSVKNEFDFNQLYHYVNALSDNLVSITLSADTALYDPNKKSVFNGMYNPTKVTYCSQLSDLVARLNMTEGTEIYELSDLSGKFEDDEHNHVLATLRYAPGKPFTRYFNIVSKKYSEATGGTPDLAGSQRFNRVHVNVNAGDKNSPYYIRYGVKRFKEEEGTRPYSYAFGMQDDKKMGVDLIIKNPHTLPMTQIPRSVGTVTNWTDFDCTSWNELCGMLSVGIGENPLSSYGAIDFRLQILSDNVDEIGICPFKIDDYAASPIKIGNNRKANPVDRYGDYSNRLLCADFTDGIPFKLADSAFAFCQNMTSAKIPLCCEFSGDHTFRMGFGYTNVANSPKLGTASKLISASPYNSYIFERRPYVVGRKTDGTNVTSAWYNAVNVGVKSALSCVDFDNGLSDRFDVYPGDKTEGEGQSATTIKPRVHVKDGVLRNTFVNCTNLLTANIQATDANTLSGTFINCEKLQEVILPDTCQYIKNRAFSGALGLKRICIPTSVEDVDTNVAWQSRFTYARSSQDSLLCSLTSDVRLNGNTLSSKYMTVARWRALSAKSGNWGLTCVGYDGSTVDTRKELSDFSANEYEIDICLSENYAQYYNDNTLNKDKIHQEISGTIEALNKTQSYFGGVIWFPTVRQAYNSSKGIYTYTYLPPFGKIFYITDRNGKYIRTSEGQRLVYDHMKIINLFDIRKNLAASTSPNKKNGCFIYDKWYTWGTGENWLYDTYSKAQPNSHPYFHNEGHYLWEYCPGYLTSYSTDQSRYAPFGIIL